MAKELLFDTAVEEAVRKGVQKISRAVKITLGPGGRNVLLDRGWGEPQSTKDGAQVAEDVELEDKNENVAAQLIKEAASKTNDKAGDGTTTTTVLAEALILSGLKALAGGHDPIALKRGMEKAREQAVEELKRLSREIKGELKGNQEVLHVSTIASGNDSEIGKVVADALSRVGREGVVTIEEGKGYATEVKLIEGMQFDRGFLSPYFVTEKDSAKVILDEPYILIYEDKLSSVAPLVPLLEKLSQSKKTLLVIAEEVEGEALATLVVNKLKGILSCAAVKAPGYGDRRKAMLEDIAILTGGKAIFKDLGIQLEKVDLSYLGQARRVIIDSENTTLEEGAGSTRAIQDRVIQIKREVEETDSDYDREKLQERLAKLVGGIAQINVGAPSETELKERKKRYEDALNATQSALEEGILPGGGVALVRVGEALQKKRAPALTDGEQVGWNIFIQALEEPLKQIMNNAGLEGDLVLKQVRGKEPAHGYDVVARQYGDLYQLGVLDATKVVREAVQNAASVSGVLLTSNVLITDVPEKAEGAAGPHSHGPEY